MGQHILTVAEDEGTLAAALLDNVAGAQKDEPLRPVVVLVRGNLVGRQLARRLARARGGHANVHFLTFIDLAHRLARSLRREKKGLPAGAARAVFAALAAELDARDYFGPVKDTAGFIEKLAAAAEDVSQAGIVRWPAQFNIGAKLSRFGSLFNGYRDLLADGGYADEYDLFAAAAAHAHDFAPLFSTRDLFIFGFYDLNEIQWRLLAALAPAVGMRAYVPYGDGPAFAFVAPTVQRLRALGFVLEGRRPTAAAAVGRSSPLAGVVAGRVVILSAPDEAREAREVVRCAVTLAREEGIRFGEMAAFYRDDSARAALVEECERVGVPYYDAAGRPLAATRAGGGVRRLLALALERDSARPFRRAAVMDFITSAPLDAAAAGGAAIEPTIWEDISAAAGILYGRAQWREQLARYGAACERRGEGDGHDPAEVRRFAAFVARLFDDIDRFPREGRWADFAAVVEDIVRKYFCPSPEREGVGDAAAALRDYDDVIPPRRGVKLRAFADIFSRRLEETALRSERREGQGLNLIKFERARGLSFRAVFIVGACEGVYPRRRAQDPIILDDERRAFNEKAQGRWRFNVRLEGAREEPLLFRIALGAAREYAQVSYHRLDAGGRERLPSYYVVKLAAALAGRDFGAEALDRAAAEYDWFRRVKISGAPRAEDALDAAEYWTAREGDLGAAGVAAYLVSDDDGCAAAAAAAAARRSPALTAYDGLVASPEGRAFLHKRFGGEAVVAARDLERLAYCPRQYFFAKVLRLRPWAEPEEMLTFPAAARGSLVHNILRDVYRELAPLADEERVAAARAAVERQVAAAFERLEQEGALPPPFVVEMERRTVAQALTAFVAQDVAALEGWRPTSFELAFGGAPRDSDDAASVAAPFRLALAGDGGPDAVEVFGRIDRVDRRDGDARIIDYKTGGGNLRKDTLAGGRQLQPALYALAYRALFAAEGPAAEVWAGYCRPFEKRGPYFKCFGGGDAAGAQVRHIVGTLLGLAHDGVFIPAVEDQGARDAPCSYCQYKAVCATARVWLNEAKRNSAPVRRYIALGADEQN